ncbi:MAG: radical SAM protein, partial [SAR324 cluster bacterium]|nr:radical SAM protein [SAR324 cluster bacterium]
KSYPFQLKFVVQAEEDLTEIHQLLDDLDMEIPPGKVLLMPEGQDSESLNRRSQSLVELCKENGYRLCQRLHVDLFGNKRGT